MYLKNIFQLLKFIFFETKVITESNKCLRMFIYIISPIITTSSDDILHNSCLNISCELENAVNTVKEKSREAVKNQHGEAVQIIKKQLIVNINIMNDLFEKNFQKSISNDNNNNDKSNVIKKFGTTQDLIQNAIAHIKEIQIEAMAKFEKISPKCEMDEENLVNELIELLVKLFSKPLFDENIIKNLIEVVQKMLKKIQERGKHQGKEMDIMMFVLSEIIFYFEDIEELIIMGIILKGMEKNNSLKLDEDCQKIEKVLVILQILDSIDEYLEKLDSEHQLAKKEDIISSKNDDIMIVTETKLVDSLNNTKKSNALKFENVVESSEADISTKLNHIIKFEISKTELNKAVNPEIEENNMKNKTNTPEKPTIEIENLTTEASEALELQELKNMQIKTNTAKKSANKVENLKAEATLAVELQANVKDSEAASKLVKTQTDTKYFATETKKTVKPKIQVKSLRTLANEIVKLQIGLKSMVTEKNKLVKAQIDAGNLKTETKKLVKPIIVARGSEKKINNVFLAKLVVKEKAFEAVEPQFEVQNLKTGMNTAKKFIIQVENLQTDANEIIKSQINLKRIGTEASKLIKTQSDAEVSITEINIPVKPTITVKSPKNQQKNVFMSEIVGERDAIELIELQIEVEKSEAETNIHGKPKGRVENLKTDPIKIVESQDEVINLKTETTNLFEAKIEIKDSVLDTDSSAKPIIVVESSDNHNNNLFESEFIAGKGTKEVVEPQIDVKKSKIETGNLVKRNIKVEDVETEVSQVLKPQDKVKNMEIKRNESFNPQIEMERLKITTNNLTKPIIRVVRPEKELNTVLEPKIVVEIPNEVTIPKIVKKSSETGTNNLSEPIIIAESPNSKTNNFFKLETVVESSTAQISNVVKLEYTVKNSEIGTINTEKKEKFIKGNCNFNDNLEGGIKNIENATKSINKVSKCKSLEADKKINPIEPKNNLKETKEYEDNIQESEEKLESVGKSKNSDMKSIIQGDVSQITGNGSSSPLKPQNKVNKKTISQNIEKKKTEIMNRTVFLLIFVIFSAIIVMALVVYIIRKYNN